MLGHNSYISNHPNFLFLPTPTGNEKYETFFNQAKQNLEKEYNKYETLDHLETTEEMPEDESFEVRLASVHRECMWQKDKYVQKPRGKKDMISLRNRQEKKVKLKQRSEEIKEPR